MGIIQTLLTDLLQTFIANQNSNNNWLNRNSDRYNQLLGALLGTDDIGPLTPTAPQTGPVAPTVAASSTTGVLNGAYRYIFVLITGYKNSDLTYNVTGFCPSAEAAPVTITNKQGSLSAVSVGTGAAVIGRAIYRTAAGGAAGTEHYCGIIWGNTTTVYADNLTDGSLGAGMPTVNGTAIPAAVPTANSTGSPIPANSAAPGSALAAGWNLISAALAYSSWDSTVMTGVAITSADLTGFIIPGDRIQLTQSGAIAYFIVTAISSTTITLFGGTNYVLANSAISNVYYSHMKSPFGFPMNPALWTIETITTTNQLGTPSISAWWAPGASLILPIGAWNVEYGCKARGNVTTSGSGTMSTFSTLSETDNHFTSSGGIDFPTSGTWTNSPYLSNRGRMLVASKTTINLLHKVFTGGTVVSGQSGFYGTEAPTRITAVCAYL
jgi:hypothetical protein